MRILICFLLVTANVWAQETVAPKRITLKAVLHNFNAKGPDCGYFLVNSIYKATVTDYNKYAMGEEILVYAQCREGFPEYLNSGKEVTIYVTDLNSTALDQVAVNFTGYTDEEIKMKKKYRLEGVDSKGF